MDNSDFIRPEIAMFVKAEHTTLENVAAQSGIPLTNLTAVFIRGLKQTGTTEAALLRVKAFVDGTEDQDLLPSNHLNHPAKAEDLINDADLFGISLAEDMSGGIGRTSDLLQGMTAVIKGEWTLDNFVIVYATLLQQLREGEWQELIANNFQVSDDLIQRVMDAIDKWGIVDLSPLRCYLEELNESDTRYNR